MGLDFIIAGFKFFNKQLDVVVEEVVGATMSSTGYVTFLDLASTTNAASAPLTAKANTLEVAVAPEPREIIWKNAHISKTTKDRRSFITNCVLSVGILLWVFPLLWIQLFANVATLKQVPGLEWIDTFHGGTLKKFVNGYLPVVALLTVILILPVIFEYVAVKYERRKTFSVVKLATAACTKIHHRIFHVTAGLTNMMAFTQGINRVFKPETARVHHTVDDKKNPRNPLARARASKDLKCKLAVWVAFLNLPKGRAQ